MHTVRVDPLPLDRLASRLTAERAERLLAYAERAREALDGRIVWNVSATATGGGVAEMLQALLAYSNGAGVDTRWLVLDGSPEFFRVTKRVHNLLHGSSGDGGRLGDAECAAYEAVLTDELERLGAIVRPGDIVLLHDPQTAGLVDGVRELGARAVWRCHVGRDVANDQSTAGWEFLQGYIDAADAVIFSRGEYAPPWIDRDRLWIIPPSLDPFSPKNEELVADDVDAILARSGLLPIADDGRPLDFVRRDGSAGTVRSHADLYVAGSAPAADARLVLQVSRWDRLKDMAGVGRGFADQIDALPDDAHLVLAGPEVTGVTDDPEGAEVLAECVAMWRKLPEAAGARISLCCLPMDDVDENARLVNALQRRASVVLQKSLVEGFGLTVTEPMWKGRPVVASRVGGIQDQIVDGESGVLLADPSDGDAAALAAASLLGDPDRAERIGIAARERVREMFLPDRHLSQYVDLFTSLDGASAG